MEESTYVNEWIAKGEVRSKRATILRLGARRFGAAPAEAQARLAAVTDSERLDRITDRIFDAVGWDDLLATP